MKEPYSPVTGQDSGLWSTPDEDAAELETQGFLRSLTRLVKPLVVVEVGAYVGWTTEAIGQALRFNGRGHLHSFERDQLRAADARARCAGLPVEVHTGLDTDSTLADPVDLLFIDGALDNRRASYERWGAQVAKGGVIAVHDSLKYPEVHEFVENLPYQHIHLRTPRGLTLACKNHSQWELL